MIKTTLGLHTPCWLLTCVSRVFSSSCRLAAPQGFTGLLALQTPHGPASPWPCPLGGHSQRRAPLASWFCQSTEEDAHWLVLGQRGCLGRGLPARSTWALICPALVLGVLCVQGHWCRLLNVVGSGFIIFGRLSAARSGVWLGLEKWEIPGLADQGGVWGVGTLGHPVLAQCPFGLATGPFP